MSAGDPRFLHNLRAPLARAQTYAKLIEDAKPEEMAELIAHLRKALEDLDSLVLAAEGGPGNPEYK